MRNSSLHIDLVTLKAFAEGDAEAFTQIYHQYYPDLYFLAKSLVGDAAPDVLADVFAEIWTKRKSFDSSDHLFYYLRSMTRNACFDDLKRHRRNTDQIRELAHLSDEGHEDIYFREIVEGRLFLLIREEIEKLPPHIREVFKLSYIEGFKNAEIAEILGIKDASVRVRKAEALKILRAAFYRSELPLLFLALLVER
ncbi:MAG TPA: sigma-70 family RNA polymerase sigma factor [Puia sp.]